MEESTVARGSRLGSWTGAWKPKAAEVFTSRSICKQFKQFQLASALCALAANALAASPICVSNTNDAGDGSLRAAITQANEAGGGAITFCITGTIPLLSTLPSLTNITITGPGTNLLTISGGDQVRVFSMNSGTTNILSGLTIADGAAVEQHNPFSYAYASGISNAGSLRLLNCVVRNCTNETSYGVGVYNAGDMEMEASAVADCDTVLWTQAPGGGIYNSGTLRMTNCSVSRCHSGGGDGGGILNEGNLTMSASIVESCTAGGNDMDGGGILNQGTAVLCGCTVSNCSAAYGAGIESWENLAVTNSTIVDNEGFMFGGGLNVGGTISLVGCTIAGNTAWFGGGVCNNDGELTMLNCTVSGNDAGSKGGGIDGAATLISSTICSNNAIWYINGDTNAAQGDGGGIYGTATSENCIFSGNTAATGNDFYGILTSQGFNLIQDTNACTIVGDLTGNLLGVDPLLGPLQDNGGPTWTHALLPGSPAIDQGTSGGLTTDQRGVPRPFDVPTIPNAGDGSDIGAFEYSPLRLVGPAMIVVEFLNETGAPATFAASVTDNCAPVSTVFTPPSGSMFPIGVSSVQVQAEDPCGSSAQCTFNVSVLGARGVMSNVLGQLVILQAAATNRGDQKDLHDTIADMTEALGTDHPAAPLWLDETHVCRGHGWRAFHNPKDAVCALKEIIKRKTSSIPDATAQNLLDRLVMADRLLAVVSIQDTGKGGGNPGKLARDLKEVTKGDQAAAEGKPAEAIQHYWHAWNQAVGLKLNVVPDLVSGKMQLQFNGAGSQAYVIQASTNLLDWVILGSSTADTVGNVAFTDQNAGNYPARFYRVVEP